MKVRNLKFMLPRFAETESIINLKDLSMQNNNEFEPNLYNE